MICRRQRSNIFLRRPPLHPYASPPLLQIEPYLTGLRPKQLDEYHEAFRHPGGKAGGRLGSASRNHAGKGVSRLTVHDNGVDQSRPGGCLAFVSLWSASACCMYVVVRFRPLRRSAGAFLVMVCRLKVLAPASFLI